LFTLGLIKSIDASQDFANHRAYMQQLFEEEHALDHELYHDDRHHYTVPGHHDTHHEAYTHHEVPLVDHAHAHPEEYMARGEHVKDIPHGCQDSKFCHTFSKFAQRNGEQANKASNHLLTTYYVVPDSLTIHEDSIHASLHLHEHEYYQQNNIDFRAAHLDLHCALFQEGIMQVKIKAAEEEERFAISNTGIGIEWDQIKVQQHLHEFVKILEDGVLISGQDKVSYKIQFDPFRIIQYVNGKETMIVNDNDNLYYDAKDLHEVHNPHEVHHPHAVDGHHANNTTEPHLIEGYSVGLDFTISSRHMFGIPERSTDFLLEETGYDKPYRLFNQDNFPHKLGERAPLYGSAPYLMGHSAHVDAAVAWMNSAETFVFINNAHLGKRTNNAFISEGNALEFYIMGAEGSPKHLQKKLSELTGYAPMPPIHSLGYNFAKYEETSAQKIIDRNHDFSKYGFPVDVFWFDINHAQNKQYTEFDYKKFSQKQMMHMNDAVAHSKRRLVAIVDPHIRANEEYHVYKEGMQLQGTKTHDGYMQNIFIRDAQAKEPWHGHCWPGDSVWMDFLNEQAQEFYQSLFHPSVFKGTNYMYGIWNDMNEPSVFKSDEFKEQVGMPMTNTHVMKDGSVIQHRWVHNAYGALQQRATYQGLLKRDRGQQRPFVLTRSFFLGSQRYGAMWTGDSKDLYSDIPMSLNQLLSLGVSGIPFTGSDIPTFMGVPEDDLFVQGYQYGMYMPFFRAHADISSQMREPWLQSPRVMRIIKDAISTRYSMIHYLYNLFFEAHTNGLPIIRPMWMEFPQNEMTFELNRQFMFGSNILVAPKMGDQHPSMPLLGGVSKVEVYLPPTEEWYDIYSKQIMPVSDLPQIIHVADEEQGTFVKGGSILPTLNFHEGRESLLDAIEDPIRLEVYPTHPHLAEAHPHAAGTLYLDDGESHAHLNHERTQVHFLWDGQTLEVMKILHDKNLYVPAATKLIDEVLIFGIDKEPSAVLNKYAMRGVDQGKVNADFVYIESAKEVHVYNLHIPIDQDLFYGQEQELLKVLF
jgi:alpha-glucosidase (family GH31 glycosyl hydrolase)